jgi:hypothetical protein
VGGDEGLGRRADEAGIGRISLVLNRFVRMVGRLARRVARHEDKGGEVTEGQRALLNRRIGAYFVKNSNHGHRLHSIVIKNP